MNKMYQDSDGKACAAKTAFMTTLAIFLVKLLLSGSEFLGMKFDVMGADVITAMAAFMVPLAGAYGWRSQTKAGTNAKEAS